MKLAGALTIAVGAAILILSMAVLPWVELGGFGPSRTLWGFTTRWPAIITGLAVAALAVSVVSIFVSQRALPFAAACLSFYLLGQVFDDAGTYTGLAVGFWLATAATVAMSVGSVLAVIGSGATRSVLGAEAGAAAVNPTAMPAGQGFTAPAAGWYPDPTGQARERYWGGTAWTAQVR